MRVPRHGCIDVKCGLLATIISAFEVNASAAAVIPGCWRNWLQYCSF